MNMNTGRRHLVIGLLIINDVAVVVSASGHDHRPASGSYRGLLRVELSQSPWQIHLVQSVSQIVNLSLHVMLSTQLLASNSCRSHDCIYFQPLGLQL